MILSVMFYLGAALTIGLIAAVSYLSGRKVKSAEEFTRASAGVGMTTGCLTSALIGGSSTIGTSQLAFSFGFSALWFTLGCGISVILMVLFTSERLRKKGILTISGVIGKEYGPTARTVNAILNTFGVAVNILAQILSGTSLAAMLFPNMPLIGQAFCIASLMLMYSIFGGIKSISASGIVKSLLICPAMFICAFLALQEVGGASTLWQAFPRERFFSLFARGLKTDCGAGISTILGILTSQAYMQSIMSAKSDRVAARSLILCAALVLPLGIAGVTVGLYMRYITPAEVLAVPELAAAAAKTALPVFIQTHFSPFFAGLILSILLITVVGSGAALSLSVCTVLKKDIIDRLTSKFQAGKKDLAFSRTLLLFILLAAALCVNFFNSNIMDVSFLSLGFRAASTFAPLLVTLFLPGRVSTGYAVTAMSAGVGTVLILKLCGSPVDPSIAGTVLSLLIMAGGLLAGHKDRV